MIANIYLIFLIDDIVAPLQGAENQPIHDALYYHYYFRQTGQVPEHFGIRTATHKLVFYPDLKENNRELFDLRNDPAEMNNLYHQPEQQEQIKALTRHLNILIKRYAEDTARFPGAAAMGSLEADRNHGNVGPLTKSKANE